MAQGVQDLLQGCLAILYQACFESLTVPQGGLQRQRSHMDLICTHIRRSAFERVDETQHGSGIELSPLKLETCLPRVKVTQELSQDCQQDFVVPPQDASASAPSRARRSSAARPREWRGASGFPAELANPLNSWHRFLSNEPKWCCQPGSRDGVRRKFSSTIKNKEWISIAKSTRST